MEEKKELEKEKIDEIESRMTTSFTISYIPIPLFRWFKEFCQRETRDNYAQGINILKCYYEFYKDIMPYLSYISDKLNEMDERIERLEGKKIEKIKQIKTFGGNGSGRQD